MIQVTWRNSVLSEFVDRLRSLSEISTWQKSLSPTDSTDNGKQEYLFIYIDLSICLSIIFFYSDSTIQCLLVVLHLFPLPLCRSFWLCWLKQSDYREVMRTTPNFSESFDILSYFLLAIEEFSLIVNYWLFFHVCIS